MEIVKTDDYIVNKIYFVRGHKVMLDRDLAALYQVEPKALNQQVSRNKGRFPESFSFRLTKEEVRGLRSHFVTANISSKARYAPRVFTEHGILMLSNVLKSRQAIKMSLRIIEVFVKMRETIMANKDVLLKLEQAEKKIGMHDSHIRELYQIVKQLIQEEKMPRPAIGFKQGVREKSI